MALTAKQEIFCQKIAMQGLNQSEAYSCAYDASKMAPASIATAASLLAGKPEVSQRIKLLKERATAAAVKKAGLTLADCIDEAGQMFEDAKALGQVSAGVAAAKLRAQLAGHLDEKKEEKKNDLDAMDVEGLVHIRDEVNIRLAKAKEALELCGELPITPVPMRRVING